MKVKAEVSIYPLRQSDLTRPIQQFVEGLKNNRLQVKVGPMSSLIAGDSQAVFESLREDFEQLAAEYEIVLTAKISNACPEIGM
ncbi:MAG: thiamine-binding protein [Desulfobacteraceae bacterium]|nr:thiamine-binding protein [Desulfobacteraceae bacterium]